MSGMRRWAAGAALALSAALGGCVGYGWDDVLYGGVSGRGQEVRGQVRAVHERSRVIELSRDGGRYTEVRYDPYTEVTYRGRRYGRPESLDRGDYVGMRVNRDSHGRWFARHIVVYRSVRDRGGVYDRDRDRARDRDRYPRDDDSRYDARTAEGRVSRIDRGDRRFQLRMDDRTVWVTVPRDAGRGVRERFSRLREGDYVRVYGRYRDRDRFELEQFR